MIHVSDIANRIKAFLLKKGEEKFKIFIRVNFNIDVYIFTSQLDEAQYYQVEFLNSLKADEDAVSYYQKNYDALKVRFNVISIDEAREDPFYAQMLNGESGIDKGSRYRFGSFLDYQPIKRNDSTTKAPVVTFYSYKGGMGRTTTMVAYALHLAVNEDDIKKKRVVIIDCDLEAPGYLNFFNLKEHKGLNGGKKNGLVEFICDAQFTNKPEELDIDDYIINVGNDNDSRFAYEHLDSIWLVPAGNLNEGYSEIEKGDEDRNDYLEGLAKINLSNVQTVVKYFDLLFEKINKAIEPDVILIDSRTGFNDIFGTAALYLSSCVVGFFGFSRQTQPGLKNLLKEYYNPKFKFNLQLVFSILPEKADDTWLETHRREVYEFIDEIGNEDVDYPQSTYLRRNGLLETIGSGDGQSDSDFVKIVSERLYEDYNDLFDKIDEQIFPEEEPAWALDSESISVSTEATVSPRTEKTGFNSNTPAIVLRNAVLRHLKQALMNVKNFAEDTQIDENQFFYRECMKQLFDVKKFIIQGYKGTGKTYLYKALADDKISKNIQKWVGIEDESTEETVFVNILPPNEASLVFDSIQYSQIEEPEYYFNVFWQVYTWNALLLHPSFESIRNESELSDQIQPLVGAGYAKTAFFRIDTLIKQNFNILIVIEKDIIRLNEYLKSNNRRLFVLYDRLDTCINPLRWNKAVSPLINYWRNNYESFSNIVPKIFVRTDLFRQIEGTNTARLENNIIHIEWSIGEVFGYFFKLIFSDKRASEAYWAIAKKVGIKDSTIQYTMTSFGRFPENQFKSLQKGEMMPFITVFFGKKVNVGVATLGNPWEYFSKELANADNSAISLRPFINTLDKNAVEVALAKTVRWVHEIISPDIYASKDVRDRTTEQYFNDLTQDAFSKDLLRFKEVIRSSDGAKYRYKAIKEDLYEELIKTTYERICKIGDSNVVKTPEDLGRMIEANGIMARIPTRKGTYYRFAPIYWYSWGLANSALEKEEKKRSGNDKDEEIVELKDGGVFEGVVVEVEINGQFQKRVKYEHYWKPLPITRSDVDILSEGDLVDFVAVGKPDKYDPNKTFFMASDVRKLDVE